MKAEGKISTIIYRNEKNGYTVFILDSEDDGYITAVGETCNIQEGDYVELDGDITYHKSYGEQLAFKSITKIMPKDTETLAEYIAKSDVKGVGIKTAEKLVAYFGDDIFDVIKNRPYEMTKVKGINEEKALAISEYINSEWERWNLTSFLAGYGVSITVANKIYDNLGINAIDIIKENPYSLLDFITSINFKTVDELGKKLDIDNYNEARLKAGILFCINEIMISGHTCIEKDILIEYACKILEVGREAIENILVTLKMEDRVFVDIREENEYVYRKSVYVAEKNIARYICARSRDKHRKKNYETQIDIVSEMENITLSNTQRQAINTCLNSNVSVITGGPGTGKTTIIKCIIDILEREKKSFVLCAPTGRAAKRITETTGKNAKTLHRLLEITKVNDNDIDAIINYMPETLPHNYVIVDEVSMVDTILMNNLINALKDSTKLILVGDSYQLPSVGPGSILKDIIESKIVDVVELTEIYRQSRESNIIVNAHRVKSGDNIEFSNKDTDLYFIETNSLEETKKEVLSLLDGRLQKYANYNIVEDVQVISPIKKTDVGTYSLNREIQNILNPEDPFKGEKKTGERIFRQGDKVMQIKNNYDIQYYVDDVMYKGVYNGDIGIVESVDNTHKELVVKFDDGKKILYDFEMLDELEHAYSITVHKSQGSEFKVVIIPLYVCYEKLFNRNLIYTAMTRAKEMLIFVGSRRVLNYMVSNAHENVRRTGLKYRIIEEV